MNIHNSEWTSTMVSWVFSAAYLGDRFGIWWSQCLRFCQCLRFSEWDWITTLYRYVGIKIYHFVVPFFLFTLICSPFCSSLKFYLPQTILQIAKENFLTTFWKMKFTLLSTETLVLIVWLSIYVLVILYIQAKKISIQNWNKASKSNIVFDIFFHYKFKYLRKCRILLNQATD